MVGGGGEAHLLTSGVKKRHSNYTKNKEEYTVLLWTNVHQQIWKPTIDKSLEKCKLPKWTQDKIKNMNKSIRSKETELVIKKVSTKKSPGPDGFTGKCYKTFTELYQPS